MSEELKDVGADDPEMYAMANVFSALKTLDSDAQQRVVDYVIRRLGLIKVQMQQVPTDKKDANLAGQSNRNASPSAEPEAEAEGDLAAAQRDVLTDEDSDLEGISPIARKWMVRNDLSSTVLSALYSLGVEEIDLVAKKVPGKSSRERLHNVLLLQGVASYLSGGVARIDKTKLKDSIAHYDAEVGGNFTSYLKGWASEISGSRSAGDLGLTTRGLVAAKDLIKEIVGATSK